MRFSNKEFENIFTKSELYSWDIERKEIINPFSPTAKGKHLFIGQFEKNFSELSNFFANNLNLKIFDFLEY